VAVDTHAGARQGRWDEAGTALRHAARQAVAPPLLAWLVLVAVGMALVYVVLVSTGEKRLDGVPLHGAFEPMVTWRVALPVSVAAGALLARPRLQRATWRRMLLSWWAFGATWAFALAASRGLHRVTAPIEGAGDYLAVLPQVTSPGAFLADFVDHIASYPTHVQGHPPGFVLVSWVLREVGASGSGWVALVVVVSGTGAIPLALVASRDVVDEAWARRAAPFLAIGPPAIWIATSADGFFTGVGAAAVTLLVLASSRAGAGRWRLAVAGGVAFGVCLLLSYGLVLLAAIPLVVIVARRSWSVLLVAAFTGLAVLVATSATGYWWLDGLRATQERYDAGIASRRPYELFLVANLSILAIALGPAIAVALWRLRDGRCWLLVGGALAAVLLADVSGMSKSEVERIWLPFMPFIALSAGAIAVRRAGSLRTLGGASGWVAVQAGAAIVVESVVRTAW
jgi:hypothetical protein